MNDPYHIPEEVLTDATTEPVDTRPYLIVAPHLYHMLKGTSWDDTCQLRMLEPIETEVPLEDLLMDVDPAAMIREANKEVTLAMGVPRKFL